MALPDGSVGNTQISMGQMRTEFSSDGSIPSDGSISMSQLYRGGGEVPANATIGASIANLTGSTVFASGGQFGAFQQAARFTSNMTCGNNGNVTANGNVVFVASGSGAGNSGQNISMSGGVKVVSTNATTNAAGNVLVGTVYESFTGSVTSVAAFSGVLTTTIPNGTSFDIPSGVTSFKMLTYVSVSKNENNQGESSASASLSNPSSGAFTSTGTTNTGVPDGSSGNETIKFSDLYGAVG